MSKNTLNLKYYKGTDLYSDGDIEDKLLDIVSNHEDYSAILRDTNEWPLLYHLSDIRENILEWYDFNPKGSILEIGSGCGALSGLFCRKSDHVVAIELSKKRSTINALRNKKHSNLEIMVGNFEDIQLEEKFDYVTLIGVFEYSICYLNSSNPFHDMLDRVKKFLKPGGKLILAIENKYGLKYWAGATEDHTGELFDSLYNYEGVERVRTFSRQGLEQLLDECGYQNQEFYYPIPDYKLPNVIYSEDNLPDSTMIETEAPAYDRERISTFNEVRVTDSLCKDGMFSTFANSFLVICECAKEEEV